MRIKTRPGTVPAIRWLIIALGCATLSSISCVAQKPSAPTVTSEEVLRILDSKNAAEVEAAFNMSQKLYSDRVARAFQKYRLDHTSEGALYAVLPASAEQVKELYRLTDLSTGHEKLVSLYEGYFQTVFRLAPHHTESFQLLFSIATNFDSPLSEGEQDWFCGLLQDLYTRAPSSYLKALAEYKHGRQMMLTGAAGCPPN